jgi:pilus assembly protein CpaF
VTDIDILIQTEGGDVSRQRLHLETPVFSIGRHAQNAVRLEGDSVSREHARVELLSQHFRIEDASSNGTFAGTTLLRHQSAEVTYGTPIRIGRYTLFIGTGAAAARANGASAPEPLNGAPVPERPNGMPAPTTETSAAARPNGASGHSEAVAPAVGSTVLTTSMIELRREIHRKLLENLDLAKLDPAKIDDPSMRPRVLTALRRIVRSVEARIPQDVDRDGLIGDLADEALGLGPLERLLADPAITEIMVVDPATIYVEKGGALLKTDTRFTDDERVRAVIERIVTPLGRRIDESSPLVDARLRDGSRVNAIIKPLALRGSCITIRRFPAKPLTLDALIELRALTAAMGRFLVRSVAVRRNIVISGGTGSGKTTLLNVLSSAIPEGERIVTIEDAAELQLKQPHVVSLETRPSNMEGKGEYTIRDLVRNALRMRPDRIVVGECRGGEALDMLQAMNTGHDGSLTTTHANSPAEALARLETLALMGGIDLPSRAIREQIATSIHVVVQVARVSDGSRKVTRVSEVAGMTEEGILEQRPIFEFNQTGTGAGGKVLGDFRATGYLPSFLDQFIVRGLVRKGEPYL